MGINRRSKFRAAVKTGTQLNSPFRFVCLVKHSLSLSLGYQTLEHDEIMNGNEIAALPLEKTSVEPGYGICCDRQAVMIKP